MNADAIIFDFNGTLIQDEMENHDAWAETARHFRGYPFSEEEFILINGKPDKAAALVINPEASEKEAEEIATYKEELYHRLCLDNNVTFTKGAEAYLSSLRIPIAIASSAPKCNMDWYIPYFGLNRWFKTEHIIAGRDDLKGKPAPDYFLEAARVLGKNIRKCIIFEDSTHGIEAAKNAGAMLTVSLKPNPMADICITDFTDTTLNTLPSL